MSNILENIIEFKKREIFELKKNYSVSDFNISSNELEKPRGFINKLLFAEKNGFGVIVAGAGGAAHLAGMVASLTTLPVLGVPMETKKLKGLDSLLSMVQMPKGVPIGCLAIDGAFNAGILAASIIGNFDEKVKSNLEKWRRTQSQSIKKKPK